MPKLADFSFGYCEELYRLSLLVYAPTEAIAVSIEFVRLADVYNVIGLESLMANYIKQMILTNKDFPDSILPIDEHTYHLMFEHIKVGVLLPEGHSVRKVLASSAVKGYLLRNHHQFFQDIERLQDFAVNFLREVKVALDSPRVEKRGMSFADPFSKVRIDISDL